MFLRNEAKQQAPFFDSLDEYPKTKHNLKGPSRIKYTSSTHMFLINETQQPANIAPS
jgi:hypothetical protein